MLSVKQSGFRPNDSCIYQLLSITHEIFSAFDCEPSLEVRSVFLDISKAFDRVWHNGLLFKLKSNGVEGKLLDLVESFLCERYQRVVLNSQSSCWLNIKAGVPQGSILGPLLFLIYMNDISNDLESNVKLFAVVVHVGSNDVTFHNEEFRTLVEAAEKILRVGEMCKVYGVNNVAMSSVLIKNF